METTPATPPAIPDPDEMPMMPIGSIFPLLGIASPTTAYNMVKAGTFPIPVKHVGKRLMCTTVAVRRYFELDAA